MSARAPSLCHSQSLSLRQRPVSSAAPATPSTTTSTLRRKHSLDHGGSTQHSIIQARGTQESSRRACEVTSQQSEAHSPVAEQLQEGPPPVTNGNEPEDVNHNGPSTSETCNRKVLKKQTSMESIGFGDNYFYDFFDRNCRPSTPLQTSSDEPPIALPAASTEHHPPEDVGNTETNNNECETSRLENTCGASSRLRRNVNNVRPKSWLTPSTTKTDDCRRIKRRQTDPCGKDFLSNYEKALSSLLYQPYDCRTDVPSSSATTFDDSDVSFWLGPNSKRWLPRERRSVGEGCSYQNDSSESSSRSSMSSSGSSLADFMRRKPWGDSKDPSSSSIRALLTDWKTGNAATERSTDLDLRLALEPPGALVTGWSVSGGGERERDSQSPARHGREMVVVAESAVNASASAGSQSELLACGREENGGVSVSCYRAVPATVSAVPVIPCSVNNNVSNVRIVQGQSTRTLVSTEAQTDDVIVAAPREQRRRERRERRHQRRLLQTDPSVWHTPLPLPHHIPVEPSLPDILNSHLPPPYTTLPAQMGMPPPHLPPPPPIITAVPGSPPPQVTGLRFPFAIGPASRRRSRLSPHFTAEDEPKSCCGLAVSQTLSIRWFIVLIFLVGICCAAVGTILGAMKATGREHLTVSLLMIGVGIVLVAVSGVAWRLTSPDAPSCRAMLGIGGDDSGAEPNRRFVPRLPPSYGRPHHPYAAMMYPEFQYRAPPPSYQASMQEYRLRLLLLDRTGTGSHPGIGVSPPPTYRSHPGSLLRAGAGLERRGRDTITPAQSEYSRPPSYRSRTSSRPDPAQLGSHTHSREPSGSEAGQAINVIAVPVHPIPHIIKLAPSSPPLPAKVSDKDANLVTIVQTATEQTGPVIVTISGQPETSRDHYRDSEMEILAHL